MQYFVFEKSDIKYPEGERIHPLLRIRFLNRRVLSHQIKIYPTSYLSVKTLLHSRNIYSPFISRLSIFIQISISHILILIDPYIMIDPFQKKYHIMLFLYVIIKYDRIGGEKKKKKKISKPLKYIFTYRSRTLLNFS